MNNPFVKYGLIGGLLAILQGVIDYVLSNDSLTFLLFLIFLAIFIYLAILAVREYRKMKGGKINFLNAFITAALTFTLTLVLSGLFSLFLNSYIDPGYAERRNERRIEKIENNENIPEERKEKALLKLRSQDTSITPVKVLTTTAISLGVFAVIAAIIGLSVKKDTTEPGKEI